MNGKRGLLLLGLPLVAGLGLLMAVLQRGTSGRETVPATMRKTQGQAPSGVAGFPRSIASSPLPPAKDVPSAVASSRIRTTYKNYKSAVAGGNRQVQEALLKSLRQDREVALLLARDEAARAKTDPERTAARRTLEALER